MRVNYLYKAITMKSFPIVARLFITFVILAGAAVVPGALYFDNFAGADYKIVIFIALGALAGSKKIRLIRTTRSESTGTMSVAFAVTYAGLLSFGPIGGMLVGLFSGLSACVYPRRQHLHQALFNMASIAVTAYTAGRVYCALHGQIGQVELEKCVLPVVASTLTYYLMNTVSVSAAIALSSGGSTLNIWHDNFLWTAPGFFAGASCAVLAHKLYWALGSNVLVLSLPILYLTYHSYRIYVEKAEQSQKHIEELKLGQEQLAALYLATIESLATAIDAKDAYTHEHINRVQTIAVKIAEAYGVAGDLLEGIRTAALLHDIGKLGVPEHILLKPGKLSGDEYAKIQRHAAIGAKILDPVQFPWPVTAIVRSHHERFDGTGYPDGLKGEEIALGARILAVADVYDALTSSRAYRDPWPHHAAVEHIEGMAGTHFDPNVVKAFLSIADQLENLEEMGIGHDALPYGEDFEDSGRERESSGAEDDIARANYELMALFEIAQTLSSTLNLDECLILLANKIKNVVRASSCVIFLKSLDDPMGLRAEVAVGANESHFYRASTKIGEGITGTVAMTKEPWLGIYVREDIVLMASHINWTDLRSALVAPLMAEGKTLGTINLYHTEQDVFTEDDLRVLNIIANQAGTAIMNAQIFERTRESAIRDPLTGLHNSRFLFTVLEQELNRAQRHSHPVSILGMDLDNFKLINDNFGHQRGDTVLKDVAEIFKSQVRDYDLVIRYSGDEFIVVLPETGDVEASNTASRIVQAVAKYAETLPSSGLAPLGVSIGLATFPDDANDLKTLLAKADAAMYEEKRRRKQSSAAA